LLKTILLYFIITVGLLWLGACNKSEPVCPDTQTFDFKLSLFREIDVTTTRLKFYNANDSIVSEDNFPTLLSVPVDLNADSTTFYIDFINDTLPTVTDKITFTHSGNIYLHDQVCGFIMEFKINSISTSKNKIDSAAWKNDQINAENESNLEIYY